MAGAEQKQEQKTTRKKPGAKPFNRAEFFKPENLNPLLERRKNILKAMLEYNKNHPIPLNPAPGLPSPLIPIFMIYIEISESGSAKSLHNPNCAAPRFKNLSERHKFGVEYKIQGNDQMTTNIRIFTVENRAKFYIGTLKMEIQKDKDDINNSYFKLYGDRQIYPLLAQAKDAYASYTEINTNSCVSVAPSDSGPNPSLQIQSHL